MFAMVLGCVWCFYNCESIGSRSMTRVPECYVVIESISSTYPRFHSSEMKFNRWLAIKEG